MLRIVSSLICLFFLIYTPYTFGDTRDPLLTQKNPSYTNDSYSLIQKNVWESYVLRKKALNSNKNITSIQPISNKNKQLHQEKISSIIKKEIPIIENPREQEIKIFTTQEDLKSYKKEQKKAPSILDPIPSIKAIF